MPSFVFRREFAFLALAVALALISGLAIWLSRATTLTVAVAPSDGTEPPLIRAYGDALAKGGRNIHLEGFP